MSIQAAIKRHSKAGRLFPLQMEDASHPPRRGFYLSQEMQALMDGPWEAPDGEDRTRRLHADLEAYVKQEPISMCLVPFKAGSANFGRLAEPEDEIWDYRTRNGLPVIRIFGRFAYPSAFIAFNWAPRMEPWNGREPFGSRDDPRWEVAKQECEKQWKTLFPKHDPIHGDDVHDYVTDEDAFDILAD